ncbi:hypothetical protein VP01_1752g2 [Puccinia sorghi]|uniref:Uncharacterized protein n=1 Tax=Puccinia sorghi TaxID=27349 RepID=A0A0L6VF10_9BASI|nr:hypothetical protein VP01_1752g2 [Puccinia sorghi]
MNERRKKKPNIIKRFFLDLIAPSCNDQEKTGFSKPFISNTSKTQSLESTIIQFLSCLPSLPALFVSKWAKMISASIHTWLKLIKKSISPIKALGESQSTSVTPEGNEVFICSPAIDFLKGFNMLIIKTFMHYIIFQFHTANKSCSSACS